MVNFRMHVMLRGRLDPSDVIQEAMFDATDRLNEYLAAPRVTFYVWLRGLVIQRLAKAYRSHLSVKGRTAFREQSFECLDASASSAIIASYLVGKLSSPSSVAIATEQKQRLEAAIDQLNTIDREIILLRHFEELTNSEAAMVLGLKATTANNRYIRALARLRAVMIGTNASSIED
jgi:RNA polymerase sigma-70 factor (ECF subfamily)